MKTIENLHPNTEAWLKWRSEGIGASDAPALFNCSPYNTAFELWQIKTGRLVKEVNTWVTGQGHTVEAKVRAMYEIDSGKSFVELLTEMKDFPFIKASLDGYCKEEPEIFIHGPNTAGAKPTVATFPISSAIPEARPPFCIPTSSAMVRQSCSFIFKTRQPQYPKKYPKIL